MVQGLRIVPSAWISCRGCIRGFMQCRRNSLFLFGATAAGAMRSRRSLQTHSCVIPHQPEAAATWYRHGRCRRRPPPPPRRRACRLPPIPLRLFSFSCSRRVLRLALQFSTSCRQGMMAVLSPASPTFFSQPSFTFPFSPFFWGKISRF